MGEVHEHLTGPSRSLPLLSNSAPLALFACVFACLCVCLSRLGCLVSVVIVGSFAHSSAEPSARVRSALQRYPRTSSSSGVNLSLCARTCPHPRHAYPRSEDALLAPARPPAHAPAHAHTRPPAQVGQPLSARDEAFEAHRRLWSVATRAAMPVLCHSLSQLDPLLVAPNAAPSYP